MSDEIIRLLLDLGVSAANAQAVVDKLDALKTKSTEVKGSYDVLERSTGTYTVAARNQESELDRLVKAAHEATQAQGLMRQALDETTASTHVVNTAATGAVGTKASGGRGLMGLSYAFQDFTSVLSNGGASALPRALGAISNNIDQIGMSAGLSVANAAKLSFAFTGMTAAIPILTGIFGALWQSMGGGEAFSATKERLKEIEAEIKKVGDAWAKMRGMPTEHESEAAKLLKSALEDRAVGGRATEAVARGVSDEEAIAELEPAQRGDIMTNDQIEQEAQRRSSGEGGEVDAAGWNRVKKQLEDERKGKLFNVRREVAKKIIVNAQEAGPAGQFNRSRLQRMAAGIPGLEGIGRATPERVEEDERAAQELDDKNAEIEGSGKAIGDARKRREQEAKDAEKRKKREVAWLKQRTNEDLANWEGVDQEAAHKAKVKQGERDALQKELDREGDRKFKEARDTNKAKVKGTDIDERAALESGLRATQGFGRKDIEREVARMVDRELQQRFPKIPRDERHELATSTATGATNQVDEKFRGAMVEAVNAGLNAAQASNAATQRTIQELRAATQKGNALARDANAMRPQQQPFADNGN
jgi:hypothetical protein